MGVMGKPLTAASWRRIGTGDDTVAVAERDALGTSARIAIWPPASLEAACTAADSVLAALDRQASRFREDSEISRVNRAGGGLFLLSRGLAEAVGVALAAARWTGGRTDPTVADALVALGYDRDFAAIGDQAGEALPGSLPAPGWARVRLDGPVLRLPAGVRLDLGATAKGLGADRAAQAALAAAGTLAGAEAGGMGRWADGGGVLVSLGGDIATAGTPPRGGWPVTVADAPDGAAGPLRVPGAGDDPRAPDPAGAQLIRLPGGAVATSSVTCRAWRRGGQTVHHIVDPATGRPAGGPWRTATVVAATCADANAAATAAIVAGREAAGWLAATGLPARLVSRGGAVFCLGGWPTADGQPVPVPAGSRVYPWPPLPPGRRRSPGTPRAGGGR